MASLRNLWDEDGALERLLENSHPPRDVREAYREDRLPTDVMLAIDAHREACPRCNELFASEEALVLGEEPTLPRLELDGESWFLAPLPSTHDGELRFRLRELGWVTALRWDGRTMILREPGTSPHILPVKRLTERGYVAAAAADKSADTPPETPRPPNEPGLYYCLSGKSILVYWVLP